MHSFSAISKVGLWLVGHGNESKELAPDGDS